MREDTPPSSLNGDEIGRLDDEDMGYLEEIEFLGDDDDGYIEEIDMEEDAYMEPVEDHAVMVFKQHVGSVFCCDFHPNDTLVATGGQDDKGFVWSIETGQVIMECTGHRDSVIFVGFSFDGAYLATTDMSGVIKVWKYMAEQKTLWPVAFEYDADEISVAFWHFGARVLICGSMTGLIYIFKIPSGETKIISGPNKKVDSAKLFHDGVRLAAGYDDGSVKIWDLKTLTVLQQLPAGTHIIGVNALDIHPDDSLVASISTDGKVIIMTANTGKVAVQLYSDNNLETVVFQQEPQTGYLALGSLAGAVTIWDLSKQMMRHQCIKEYDKASGITKMIWVKNHLITACVDGSVHIYDSSIGERIQTYTGHSSEILDIYYNERKKIILSTSDDGTARIFKHEIV